MYPNGSPRGEYYTDNNTGLTIKQTRFLNNLIFKEFGITDEADWKLYLKSGYNAKDRRSAATNASLLKNSKQFKGHMKTFREQLKETIGGEKVSERLKTIIFEGHDRESLNGIKEYNKVMGNYAPKDYNVDINRDRADVFEGHVVDDEIEDDDDDELLEEADE